jgi:spore coat protein X
VRNLSEKKWKALDDCDTKGNQADVMQEAEQVVSTKQQSFEWIIIRDSEGVEVHTTDTQRECRRSGT